MSCRSPVTVPIATRPLARDLAADQVRAQDLECRLHRVSAEQHLGDVVLPHLESPADLAHRGHQPVRQQRVSLLALLQRQAAQRSRLIRLTGDDGVTELVGRGHCAATAIG